MKIDINQHKISFGDKYNIYVDEKLTFKASTNVFRFFLSEITLSDLHDKQQVCIEQKFNWIKPKYIISGLENGNWTFKSKQIWKMHYDCKVGNSVFDIYGHKRRKVSIFQNGAQVGFFDKEAVSWFEGDNYRLIANDDCDSILMASFVLIWDNFFNNNAENSTVTFDLGNIGPETRKFDQDWRPKRKIKNAR